MLENFKSFKKASSPISNLDDIEELTEDEKRARARRNWAKLRDHIKQMKNSVNFLVTTLEEANEARQAQNMNGFDVIDRSNNYNDKGLDATGKPK